jgi:hypothetical protein
MSNLNKIFLFTSKLSIEACINFGIFPRIYFFNGWWYSSGVDHAHLFFGSLFRVENWSISSTRNLERYQNPTSIPDGGRTNLVSTTTEKTASQDRRHWIAAFLFNSTQYGWALVAQPDVCIHPCHGVGEFLTSLTVMPNNAVRNGICNVLRNEASSNPNMCGNCKHVRPTCLSVGFNRIVEFVNYTRVLCRYFGRFRLLPSAAPDSSSGEVHNTDLSTFCLLHL